MRTALVCGVLGQDGSYLAESLLADSCRVVGTVSSAGWSAPPADRRELLDRIEHVETDFMTVADWRSLIGRFGPDEIYNLAGRTTGTGMYDDAVGMGDSNGLAVVRLLDAIRLERPSARFCQASSSEMFGDPSEAPQSERTPLRPASPYAAAKAYAHAMIGVYRERHGLFACSAILFNHESPRRPPAFVTRKVTTSAARISLGFDREVTLGDLSARRDWGYAPDFVRAMRAMLGAQRADDFVVATGALHSVEDLCRIAFGCVGLDFRRHVVGGQPMLRRDESRILVGDAAKARAVLGWTPSLGFEDMVRLMVQADVERLRVDRPHGRAIGLPL